MIISTGEFKLTHRHKNMVNLGHLFLTCLWKRTESTQIKQSLRTFGGWPSSSEQQLRKLLSPFLFANELREKFLPTGKDWSKLQLQDGVGCLMFVPHLPVVQPFQRSYLGSASTLSLYYTYPSVSLLVWCSDLHCFSDSFRDQHLKNCNST